MNFKNISILFLLVLLFCICSGFAGCKTTPTAVDTLPGTPGVGSVDQSVITNLPAFQDAEKKFETERKKLASEYSDMAKGLTDKQKSAIQTEYQRKLMDLQYSIISPLREKQKKSIEDIAKEENLSVVLDATVVVCGVTDITDKVKKSFTGEEKKTGTQAKEEPTRKAEKTESTPKQIVGYLSLEKFSDLPQMMKAQDEFKKIFDDMQKKLEKETKELYGDNAMPPASFLSDYQKKFDSKKQEILKPVEDEINKAAGDIAKEKGLVIILDESEVLYGGVDITDEVKGKLKK